jgi:hypothetical protein
VIPLDLRKWRNWQTRKPQELVPEREWRFEPSLPHQQRKHPNDGVFLGLQRLRLCFVPNPTEASCATCVRRHGARTHHLERAAQAWPPASPRSGVGFVSLAEGIERTPRRQTATAQPGSPRGLRAGTNPGARPDPDAGLASPKTQGRVLDRPRVRGAPKRLLQVAGLSVRERARAGTLAVHRPNGG